MYPSVNKDMQSPDRHPPVILLLGKRSAVSDPVDAWLAKSRYSAFEAADPFQALEQISDFTLAERPDVIFLHVDSVADDFDFMRSLVTTSADEPDVPIIDFAESSSAKCAEDFEKAIEGLACKLDEYIPRHDTANA